LQIRVLSNFQYEGAAYEDGKGPNIWDTYTHEHPGLFLSLQHCTKCHVT